MPESSGNQQRVLSLLRRGVDIPCPASVEVAPDVDPDRIAAGVLIHTGCRIAGSRTSIGPGSVLGAESPVTIEDCQLGYGVGLKGGFHSGATYLDGASMGSGAQVRPGTLLEEQASGAHNVGLKQTLFLPFVTAGSLINCCDLLMAGGTSRKNHSEIGSSYIHFNYTPHQDKATPSLLGDVPHGVMLDQAPIFLGGQGGLVGPVRIAYGSVIPAGIICRQDILEENRLYAAPQTAAIPGPRAFRVGAYRAIQRVVLNNLVYIGNIQAWRKWYCLVRRRMMSADPFRLACCQGAERQLALVLDERINRLGELAKKMVASVTYATEQSDLGLPPGLVAQQQALIACWPELEASLRAEAAEDIGAEERDAFLAAFERLATSTPYLEAVRGLSPAVTQCGTAWLQAIVDSIAALWGAHTSRIKG